MLTIGAWRRRIAAELAWLEHRAEHEETHRRACEAAWRDRPTIGALRRRERRRAA